MSKDWTQEELKAASSAMEEMNEMGYDEFCEELKKEEEMTNKFERVYEKMQTAIRKLDAASEEAREAAKADYEKIKEVMACLSPEEQLLWRWYQEARYRGNAVLDISEPVPKEKVGKLVDTMRVFGVDTFTISSTWSEAIEMLYNFQSQKGCTLAGWTHVQTSFLRNMPDERPAAMFYIY